jgi:hypothetical protein
VVQSFASLHRQRVTFEKATLKLNQSKNNQHTATRQPVPEGPECCQEFAYSKQASIRRKTSGLEGVQGPDRFRRWCCLILLGLAPWTIAFHMFARMEQLGLKNGAELVQYAVRLHGVAPRL